MSLLGKIIKKAIDLGDQVVDTPDPIDAQSVQLTSLLEKAKETAFGQHYHFDEILAADKPEEYFRKQVPAFDYHRMYEQWWHRTVSGEEDISWPGRPEYFALSSGTTGSSSKRVPVTGEMIAAIRETGIKQVLSLSDHNLPDTFFEKQILMLGSSTDLEQVDGHFEGEISGISASNIPFWFKGYYKPGDEIAQIDNWDERVLAIAKEAPSWDIGAISGIPSWIELMLKKVIEYNKAAHIHEIWPNLAVYTSGGVAFEPYRSSFNSLTKKPMLYLDTYLASEGFLAFQARKNDEMAMQLSYDTGIYFEFIPFQDEYFEDDGSPKPDVPSLTIKEVEEQKDYAVLISTVTGAWRYSIGDTIKFTDKEKAEIKITGRTKHFLNVVGAQLSVNKLNEAILAVEEKFERQISDFTVGAVKIDGSFYHQWIIGAEDSHKLNQDEVAQFIDKTLKEHNKNYGVARSKALKGVKVAVVQPDVFHQYHEMNKKKGGQIKTPRMMEEDELEKLLQLA